MSTPSTNQLLENLGDGQNSSSKIPQNHWQSHFLTVILINRSIGLISKVNYWEDYC